MENIKSKLNENKVKEVSGGVGDINVTTDIGGIRVDQSKLDNSKKVKVEGNISGDVSL